LKTQFEYAGPIELDIGIGIPNEKLDVSYLEFNSGGRPKLYSGISMCGYPAGNQSLNPQKMFIGMRFSPIIQFGHISGFMPTDFTPNPYALQTDIVGTGGSSGSPIILLENGKVIGLAQQVLTAGVKFKTTRKNGNEAVTSEIFGTANLGLVYGVSTQLFPTLPKTIKSAISTRTPIMIPFHSSNLRQIGIRKSPNKPWLD
jgi:hypothetical protein